jgi:hypothetical protein
VKGNQKSTSKETTQRATIQVRKMGNTINGGAYSMTTKGIKQRRKQVVTFGRIDNAKADLQ